MENFFVVLTLSWAVGDLGQALSCAGGHRVKLVCVLGLVHDTGLADLATAACLYVVEPGEEIGW